MLYNLIASRYLSCYSVAFLAGTKGGAGEEEERRLAFRRVNCILTGDYLRRRAKILPRASTYHASTASTDAVLTVRVHCENVCIHLAYCDRYPGNYPLVAI